jgi:4-hydroxy-tetrahydrodipicolinate reductase
MSIALLGKGKTGSKVLELTKDEVEVFDRTHTPNFERLKKHDVIISFLPGDAFLELIPLLLETKLPVVTGSTGLTWPQGFSQVLADKNLTWIYGTNFSLGVVAVKQLIEKLNQVSHLFPQKSLSIHDSPNGNRNHQDFP